MHILIVSATPFEIAPLLGHLSENFSRQAQGHFFSKNVEVEILVTGVGGVFTAYHLGAMLAQNKYDLVVNAGVAGSFKKTLKLGEVVNVVTERFGDLGVEERDGTFTDMHELGFIEKDEFPFQNGLLKNPSATEFDFLKKCNGLTVNKVHGSKDSIEAIQKKYDTDVESMEGAAFFLACLLADVPFLEIRAISNFVEPRNREAWELPLAIKNLNGVLIELVGSLKNDAS